MLYEEFVTLTGYRSNLDEYTKIESNYMAFDGDKQAFCKAWLLVNSATVEQYKADVEKLSRMKAKEIALVKYFSRACTAIERCKMDIQMRSKIKAKASAIEYARSRLAMWRKRRDNCRELIHKLRCLINAFEYQMIAKGFSIP